MMDDTMAKDTKYSVFTSPILCLDPVNLTIGRDVGRKVCPLLHPLTPPKHPHLETHQKNEE
jgi:hypothetical protein